MVVQKSGFKPLNLTLPPSSRKVSCPFCQDIGAPFAREWFKPKTFDFYSSSSDFFFLFLFFHFFFPIFYEREREIIHPMTSFKSF